MTRIASVFLVAGSLVAAELYFPPADDARWESADPAKAGWDAAALDAVFDFAHSRRSTGVVILHRGRILAERRWGPPARNAGPQYMSGKTADGQVLEDVASVQKSVTAILCGIARHKGLLATGDAVSKYLGGGWTKTPAANEAKITLRHLLTMTSGLSDDLAFEAEPGTKWRYNSTAYRKLLPVLAKASGKSENDLTREWLTAPLGMRNSAWHERPRAEGALGFRTTARDLARLGLLIQAGGVWNGKPVIADREWLREMLSPSQELNRAYGFLWWLNGQPVLRGNGARAAKLVPTAPDDMVSALGALGRKVHVTRSIGLVVTRTGGDAELRGEEPFDRELWRLLTKAAPANR